jgi:hypothetical protein
MFHTPFHAPGKLARRCRSWDSIAGLPPATGQNRPGKPGGIGQTYRYVFFDRPKLLPAGGVGKVRPPTILSAFVSTQCAGTRSSSATPRNGFTALSTFQPSLDMDYATVSGKVGPLIG